MKANIKLNLIRFIIFGLGILIVHFVMTTPIMGM